MGDIIKGYKVFNPNWTCKGFQYEVGKIYEMDETPVVGVRGFHFCENLKNCFLSYSKNVENRIAEVIAVGNIDREGDCLCTNKIIILKEVPWEVAFEMLNSGTKNRGFDNMGDYNFGNNNSGSFNFGSGNRGHDNKGCSNTGNMNLGDQNLGSYNDGSFNYGSMNNGSFNIGDWNVGGFAFGCFNTERRTIFLFNKPSEWTLQDWLESPCRVSINILMHEAHILTPWCQLTEREKEIWPQAKTCGLLKHNQNFSPLRTWRCLSLWNRGMVLAIPNFNKEIFKQITGIDVSEDLASPEMCETVAQCKSYLDSHFGKGCS